MGEMAFVPSTLQFGYHALSGLHTSEKLMSILTDYYGKGEWSSGELRYKNEGDITEVPDAIFYCACKITSKSTHHAVGITLETGGAFAGMIAGSVAPGVGTALGAAVGGGVGWLGTQTVRGAKHIYKQFIKGTLHKHRNDAATVLANHSWHPIDKVRENLTPDDKAAIEAVIVIIGKYQFSAYYQDEKMLHTLIYNNLYSW